MGLSKDSIDGLELFVLDVLDYFCLVDIFQSPTRLALGINKQLLDMIPLKKLDTLEILRLAILALYLLPCPQLPVEV